MFTVEFDKGNLVSYFTCPPVNTKKKTEFSTIQYLYHLYPERGNHNLNFTFWHGIFIL